METTLRPHTISGALGITRLRFLLRYINLRRGVFTRASWGGCFGQVGGLCAGGGAAGARGLGGASGPALPRFLLRCLNPRRAVRVQASWWVDAARLVVWVLAAGRPGPRAASPLAVLSQIVARYLSSEHTVGT